VVPTPTRPEVSKVDKAPFGTLDADYPFTQPELLGSVKAGEGAPVDLSSLMGSGVGVSNSPAGLNGLGGGNLGGAGHREEEPPPPVVVLSEQRVGNLTAFVVAANDAAGFQKWLDDNGLHTTESTRAWLAHYVRLNFYFAAMRYDPPPKGASTGMTSETVRIRFQTANPYYPYREPAAELHAPASTRALFLWFVSQSGMLPVAPLEGKDDQVSWQQPWRSGMRYTASGDALKRALPGVAEAFPASGDASSTGLVVQTFTDYKRSREHFGDALMVPRKPVTLDTDGVALRRPLLAVIDPTLEPDAITGGARFLAAAPVDASLPDASLPNASGMDAAPEAATGAEPAPARTSHGCTTSEGGSGEGGMGWVLGGMMAMGALRRRRWLGLAVVGVLGCRGPAPTATVAEAAAIASPSASAPSSQAASAAAIAPALPAPLTDRELAALDLLSGKLPDGGLKVNAGWAPAPAPVTEGFGCADCRVRDVRPPVGDVSLGTVHMSVPVANAESVVRSQIVPRAKRCYQRGLEQDPSMAGKLIIAIHLDTTGEVSSASVASNTGLSSSVGSCIVRVSQSAKFAENAGSTLMVPITFVHQ
jgi:MYXO-CTERM domain-containing protein